MHGMEHPDLNYVRHSYPPVERKASGTCVKGNPGQFGEFVVRPLTEDGLVSRSLRVILSYHQSKAQKSPRARSEGAE